MPAEAFTTVRYRCPFCRRSWSSKTTASEHVARCWLDQANRTCKTCKHHWPGAPATYDEPMDPEGCEVGANIYDPDGELSNGRFYVQTDCPLWASVSAPEEADRG